MWFIGQRQRSTWLRDAITGHFDVTRGKWLRRALGEGNKMKWACIEVVELLESMRMTDLRPPTSFILRLKYIWSLAAKCTAGDFSSRQEHRCQLPNVSKTCDLVELDMPLLPASSTNGCRASTYPSFPSPGPSTWSGSSVHQGLPRSCLTMTTLRPTSGSSEQRTAACRPWRSFMCPSFGLRSLFAIKKSSAGNSHQTGYTICHWIRTPAFGSFLDLRFAPIRISRTYAASCTRLRILAPVIESLMETS